MVKAFEIGKVYSTRSICDYDTIYSWTVVARTAKRLTLEDKWGHISKRGIRVYDGVEYCLPQGSYSMAPSINADKAGEIY